MAWTSGARKHFEVELGAEGEAEDQFGLFSLSLTGGHKQKTPQKKFPDESEWHKPLGEKQEGNTMQT